LYSLGINFFGILSPDAQDFLNKQDKHIAERIRKCEFYTEEEAKSILGL